MQKYNIAGVEIKIIPGILNNVYFTNQWKIFCSNKGKSPDLTINTKTCETIQKPEEKVLFDKEFKWAVKSGTDTVYCVYKYTDCPGSDEVMCMLETDGNWDSADIAYINRSPEIECVSMAYMTEILFRNNILFHNGIVLHASAIKWEGKGILFSAPSRTGKSTQTNLWRTYMGAKVLNDDRPPVRLVNGIPYIYGSPWSGSSNEYSNDSSTLSVIIVLEQAPQNSIRRLSVYEAVSRLLKNFFLPYHDMALMERAMGIIQEIISKVPVYLLKCRPDREAVDLVYRCIK